MKTSLRESGIRFGSNLTARSNGDPPNLSAANQIQACSCSQHFPISAQCSWSAHIPDCKTPLKGFIWSKSNLSTAIVAVAIVSVTRYSMNLILQLGLLMDREEV